MSGEKDFHTMLMQIEQLAAENAVLKHLISTASSNPRGFEEFYPKGILQDRYGFMSIEDEQPMMGKIMRRRYGFFG